MKYELKTKIIVGQGVYGVKEFFQISISCRDLTVDLVDLENFERKRPRTSDSYLVTQWTPKQNLFEIWTYEKNKGHGVYGVKEFFLIFISFRDLTVDLDDMKDFSSKLNTFSHTMD